MTRIVRAELLRLVRRRTVVVIALGAVLFAVVATLTVFSSAHRVGVQSAVVAHAGAARRRQRRAVARMALDGRCEAAGARP